MLFFSFTFLNPSSKLFYTGDDTSDLVNTFDYFAWNQLHAPSTVIFLLLRERDSERMHIPKVPT